MAYKITDPLIGPQPIAVTDTTKNHQLGTIVRAEDVSYGAGEFIYLQGIASTVVGSMVDYDSNLGVTALSPATGGLGQVAVAMSINVASQYGWYQIAGNAVVKKTAVAVTPQVTLFLSATAGRVKVLASAGLQLLGARSANLATIASTVSTVTVTINRPHLQGQIT